MDQQLIDRIYECSFAPELWPGVLDELAKLRMRGEACLFSPTRMSELDCLGRPREGMERIASD